ncbi:MAG: hypothetical protein BRC29_03895 [Nanohaloarchaea archaeon SW_7_43_1]|nr:MAG: hypothetical protein BRC29_03895 [Nanohaloarchaea archaeon SW_7_43_1]
MGFCLGCVEKVKDNQSYCGTCGLQISHGNFNLTLSAVENTPETSISHICEEIGEFISTIVDGVRKETFESVEKFLETSTGSYGIEFQLFPSSVSYSQKQLLACYFLYLKKQTGEDLGEIMMDEEHVDGSKPDELKQIGFEVLNVQKGTKELFSAIFGQSDGTLGSYMRANNKFNIYSAPQEVVEQINYKKLPKELRPLYKALDQRQDPKVSKAVLSHEMTHAYIHNELKAAGTDLRKAPNKKYIDEGAAWSVTYLWTDELSPNYDVSQEKLVNYINAFLNHADSRTSGKARIDAIRRRAVKIGLADIENNGLENLAKDITDRND